MRKHLAQLRKHGGIGEVKEKSAHQKDKQHAIACQGTKRCVLPWSLFLLRALPTRKIVIDLIFLDGQHGSNVGKVRQAAMTKDRAIANKWLTTAIRSAKPRCPRS